MLEDMGQFISGLWAMLLVMIVCSNYSPPYREGLEVGPYGIYVSPHSALRFSRKALPPS